MYSANRTGFMCLYLCCFKKQNNNITIVNRNEKALPHSCSTNKLAFCTYSYLQVSRLIKRFAALMIDQTWLWIV